MVALAKGGLAIAHEGCQGLGWSWRLLSDEGASCALLPPTHCECHWHPHSQQHAPGARSVTVRPAGPLRALRVAHLSVEEEQSETGITESIRPCCGPEAQFADGMVAATERTAGKKMSARSVWCAWINREYRRWQIMFDTVLFAV